VDHTFVFRITMIRLEWNAFSVDALDRDVQPSEVVATIDKRNLRKQQNEEDT
jgi:hypothetical protein